MGSIIAHRGLLMVAGGASAFTLNPSDKAADIVLSSGNLHAAKTGGNDWDCVRATGGKSSGKWYWEVVMTQAMTNTREIAAITKGTVSLIVQPGSSVDGYGYNGINGFLYNNNSGSAYGATYDVGDIIGIEFDASAGTLKFFKNNTSQGLISGIAAGTWFPTIALWDNSGQATAMFTSASQTYPTRSGGFLAIGD